MKSKSCHRVLSVQYFTCHGRSGKQMRSYKAYYEYDAENIAVQAGKGTVCSVSFWKGSSAVDGTH